VSSYNSASTLFEDCSARTGSSRKLLARGTGTPIYGGQKCLKRVFLAETFSRSELVLLPFCTRSSPVNDNTPKYGQAMFAAKVRVTSLYRAETGGNEFERLNVDRVQMDVYEIQIDYIVGVRAFSAEERNFVYVQISPEKPTGLYKYSEGALEQQLQESLGRNWGYYIQEEYGIWQGKFITREEHDDGASMIDG